MVKLKRRKMEQSCAIFALIAVCFNPSAFAQEYIRNLEPAPDSAEELKGPIEVAFSEPEPPLPVLLKKTKKSLGKYPPFIADMRLDLNSRSYYFLRDLDSNIITMSEALATGGSIRIESGWAWDRVSVGAEYFGSFHVAGPDSRPGSGLLKPIQQSFDVLGQAFIRLRHNNQVLTIGRQRYDLPYLNSNDGRMVPYTFEGYSIDGRWRHGRFFAGYVRKIKLRPLDKFIFLSNVAGVPNSNEGSYVLGIRYEKERGFIGAIASVVPDVFSTVYSELGYSWSGDKWSCRIGGQFTDQRSIGEELLAGESFDTQAVGVRFAASYQKAVMTAAFSIVSDDRRIEIPLGALPFSLR